MALPYLFTILDVSLDDSRGLRIKLLYNIFTTFQWRQQRAWKSPSRKNNRRQCFRAKIYTRRRWMANSCVVLVTKRVCNDVWITSRFASDTSSRIKIPRLNSVNSSLNTMDNGVRTPSPLKKNECEYISDFLFAAKAQTGLSRGYTYVWVLTITNA